MGMYEYLYTHAMQTYLLTYSSIDRYRDARGSVFVYFFMYMI